VLRDNPNNGCEGDYVYREFLMLVTLKVLLWEPQQGHPNRGRSRTTYIDTIKADTGLDNTKEIRDAMPDQVVWKDFIRMARDDPRRE